MFSGYCVAYGLSSTGEMNPCYGTIKTHPLPPCHPALINLRQEGMLPTRIQMFREVRQRALPQGCMARMGLPGMSSRDLD